MKATATRPQWLDEMLYSFRSRFMESATFTASWRWAAAPRPWPEPENVNGDRSAERPPPRKEGRT
jgi:hypothetical protein